MKRGAPMARSVDDYELSELDTAEELHITVGQLRKECKARRIGYIEQPDGTKVFPVPEIRAYVRRRINQKRNSWVNSWRH